MAILSLKASQPENARHDRVAARRVWIKDLTGRSAASEDLAQWLTSSYFSGDFEFAQRRAAAARVITFAKPGSRNRIPGDPVLPVIDVHRLIRDAHEHDMCRVLRNTGGEDCSQSERKQPSPQTLHGLHLYQKSEKGRV
jgi:hypothetical protein